jgi:prevent-host-death family protein
MSLIGVRELQEQTSEVIRRVRQDRADYVVTYQGRPVVIILPLDAGWTEREMVQASKKAVLGSWERYERLAEELRRAWPTDLSNQDVIDSIRR